MGASRKLQGEIDRVLKKVQEGVDVFDSIWNKVYDTENANQKEKFEADLKKEIKKLQRYRDQIKTWIQSSEIKDKKALVDARKLIEREMERFKVCEKETKTKAFSKEGLGQQPKTDPREKAKADTRDWLNNMVSELESQVDCFEADIEGLPKKGKSKPPKLSRLEESIVRHKAHIVKLELVLRLLDNDELSPEQVNEVKELVEDYVERNQVDFDEFGDVDDIYNSLPLDKVEGLEDLVASVPPAVVVKEKAAIAAATGAPAINGSSLKASVPVSASQTVPSTAANQQVIGKEDQIDETESQDSSSDTRPQTPNTGVVQNAGTTTSCISSSGTASGQNAAVNSTLGGSGSLLTRGLGAANSSSLLVGTGSIRVVTETPNPAIALPLVNVGREEDGGNFPGRRVSDVATARSLGRAPVVSGIVASQSTSLGSMPLSSSAISGVAAGPDVTKKVALGGEDRVGSTASQQPQGSPLAGQNRVLMQQGSKLQDGTAGNESGIGADGNLMGTRIFNPTLPASQWRPPSANSFQNQLEIGQYRGRTEIAPDQREKFLQRFQQVQQQGHGNALLGSSQLQHMAGSTQKPQPSLLQQAQLQLIQQQHQQQQGSHLQSSQASTLQQQQNGVGIGLQTQALPAASTGSQQQLVQSTAMDSAPQQVIGAISTLKENEVSPVKLDDQQLHHSAHKLPEESNSEATASSGYGRNFLNDDDLKNSYTFDVAVGGPGSLSEFSQLSKDADLSPGQPVTSLPPIGRRSVSDLGAIGDNLVGSGVNAHVHNHQMLEAAFYKLPHPKDHERARNYVPKHPAVTPSYYPQTPAPITDNPALWQRLDPDTLFFAFYHQQNTYQQYLAARELKRQSWRYHRKYNTWFQRYAEPKVTTDEYEQGTYVYFDYHIQDDFQQGWCQRKKAEFVFEYSYLEDELGV